MSTDVAASHKSSFCYYYLLLLKTACHVWRNNSRSFLLISQVTRRQLKKELKLPEFANVDHVEHRLEDDGKLIVDIVLTNEGPYKCHVTTQDLSPTSAAAAAAAGDVDDNDDDIDNDDVYSADINGFSV